MSVHALLDVERVLYLTVRYATSAKQRACVVMLRSKRHGPRASRMLQLGQRNAEEVEPELTLYRIKYCVVEISPENINLWRVAV